MNTKKQQMIDMYMQKIAWYSTYVDCFTRIINEFLENGDYNIKSYDIPNLMEFNTKLTHRLHNNIMKIKSEWEFRYR